MNGYELSRSFFDWAFENPDVNTPTHTATYMWIIDKWNRSGQVKKLVLPSSESMAAIGVKSYTTYIKVLHDLIDFGFIEMVQKSKNQYTANIIALSKFDKALDKALDKAMIKHTPKQIESTIQSTHQSTPQSICTIYKQGNKVTKEQSNIGVDASTPTPKVIENVFLKNEYLGKYKTIEDLPKLPESIDYHVCQELRLEVFRSIEKKPEKYPSTEIIAFIRYWSELNEAKNLPRWKIARKKTNAWQTSSRLSTWMQKSYNSQKNDTSSNLRTDIRTTTGANAILDNTKKYNDVPSRTKRPVSAI